MKGVSEVISDRIVPMAGRKTLGMIALAALLFAIGACERLSDLNDITMQASGPSDTSAEASDDAISSEGGPDSEGGEDSANTDIDSSLDGDGGMDGS